MKKRTVPEGFKERMTENQNTLVHEFHCSCIQIRRWRAELGYHAERKNPRRVLQIDDSGEVVAVHESVCAAGKSVFGSPSNISKCASGAVKKAYGYRWEYAKEEEQ